MNIGKACAIFVQIKSDKYTGDEKAVAIHEVLGMATLMSIPKDKMLEVIRYLWDMLYEIEEGERDG